VQHEAKTLKKAERERQERERKKRREEERAAREADVAAVNDDEDRLPEDVLQALAGRIGDQATDDSVAEEDEDRRALQRRIVSQQLRALHTAPSKKKTFGEGRAVGAGIVVKSLKHAVSGRARGVSESRSFLESRLGRHARGQKDVLAWEKKSRERTTGFRRV
jgi:hypothetical protein